MALREQSRRLPMAASSSEAAEPILGSAPSPREALLRSVPTEALVELEALLEAGEVEKAGQVRMAAAAGRYVVGSPRPSRESRLAGAAPGPPEPAVRSEEPPVDQAELAPVELDGEPVDPDPPSLEMVAAPRHTGPPGGPRPRDQPERCGGATAGAAAGDGQGARSARRSALASTDA
jgi:hypothetical protein